MARRFRLARIAPAATGRAAPKALPCWVTPTARACATTLRRDRGIRRIPRADPTVVAASTTCAAPAAAACSTASPRTSRLRAAGIQPPRAYLGCHDGRALGPAICVFAEHDRQLGGGSPLSKRRFAVTHQSGRFSNRPSGVKHFQVIHHLSVDVAHGLALLSGLGTEALPSWDSKTRWNNLLGGLAVNVTAGSSRHTNSPHPSSRGGHHSTVGWI